METDLKYLNEHLPVNNFEIFKRFYEAIKCSSSKTFSVDNHEFEIHEMRDLIFEIENDFELIIDDLTQKELDYFKRKINLKLLS